MLIFRILFYPLDLIDRIIWRRSYGREVVYFQELQRSIEQEHVEMGKRWAAEDLLLLASGQAARGCPMGTPGRTLAEYQRILAERAPVPVELPRWEHAKV